MPKLSNNQKGVGLVLVIIIIVVVLAIGGVVAWMLTKNSSPKTVHVSTSTVTNATNTASVSKACLKLYNNDNSLCAFAGHVNISTQQYVATGTATSAAGTTSTFTVHNDGKGNTEVNYGSGAKELSSITLDGITYFQPSPGATWIEYSNSGLTTANVPNPTSGFKLNFTSNTTSGVTVTKDGTVACGSLTCDKYKVTVASTPNTTQYVLFDTKNYLLRQWTSNDTSTGVAVDLTFNYQPVSITKPSPVQTINP